MLDTRPDPGFLIDAPKINLAQSHLLTNLAIYLRGVHHLDKDEKIQPNSQRDYTRNIIEQVEKYAEKGSCFGFTVVTLYAVWLQKHPPVLKEDKPMPELDNWDWLKRVLIKLSTFNGDASTLSETDKADFDRLTSLVLLHQGGYSEQLLGFGQPEIEKAFEDTAGRVMQKRYAIAGILTKGDLVENPNERPRQSRFLVGRGGNQLNQPTTSQTTTTPQETTSPSILKVVTQNNLPVLITGYKSLNVSEKDWLYLSLSSQVCKSHKSGIIIGSK